MNSGMAVKTPTLIYAWPKSREEFDKIDLVATEHEWKKDRTLTVLKHDGQQWESKVISKSSEGAVWVIFQWQEERPARENALRDER